jgi:hypothetical protein
MGMCNGKPRDVTHRCNKLTPEQVKEFGKSCTYGTLNSVVQKLELTLLSLIYYDLATRTKGSKMTRETFSDFFNMIVFH